MLTFGLMNSLYVGPVLHVWIVAIVAVVLIVSGLFISLYQAGRYEIQWPAMVIGIVFGVVGIIMAVNLFDIYLYRSSLP